MEFVNILINFLIIFDFNEIRNFYYIYVLGNFNVGVMINCDLVILIVFCFDLGYYWFNKSVIWVLVCCKE